MKKSKRYIKKQNNKPLINKKVLAKVIRESNICKHAIKELKLAGYGNGEGGPNDWMYQQVIEAVAVFASHGNSGSSAPWETGGYFTLDDLDCIKVKFEIEKPIGDLANKINFDLLNTFFNHQHEMTRSSSINKTTMKNILNDGRDISIAKLVENTSLIIK